MSDAIVGEHARDRVVVDLSFVSYSSPRRASSPERLQADIIVCIIGIVSTLRERRPGVGAVVRSIHKTKEACAFNFFQLWKRSRTYIWICASRWFMTYCLFLHTELAPGQPGSTARIQCGLSGRASLWFFSRDTVMQIIRQTSWCT